MPRVGVLGSLVWDVIHGRDPAQGPIEEWGGIAYALGGFDAALPAHWEIVPLVKVGRDLAPRAADFLATLTRLQPGVRCVEVPVANNRVELRYQDHVRRCERMWGGVPGWTWVDLGPMVRDLDALYVNFISGFELELGTAEALRRGFQGPIYCDFHSLFLAMGHDGIRTLQPLPGAPSWYACFDVIQMNEEEMRQVGPDPLAASARMLDAGVGLLIVTLGPLGVAYVAAPGFERLQDRTRGAEGGATIRSARIPPPETALLDPTGCGDVFGAVACARLLAGDDVETALREANRLAARNAAFRGATGLGSWLRGELTVA